MKTRAQVKDIENKLNDLQVYIKDTLESYLERQSTMLTEHIKRHKVENEELRKGRDHKVKEKEYQVEELREGPCQATERQLGEERVSPEIVKRNKLEKVFLYLL